MKKILDKILNGIAHWFIDLPNKERDEYLSQATDIVDLERRMRDLESGKFIHFWN